MWLRTVRWLWIAVAVWWLFGGAVVCAAKGYPRQDDRYVNDYAGVIGQQELQRIRTMLAEFKQQSGIDATALTIRSINDYHTGDKSIESFAHHLFNNWGIGDRATNKGVLLVVAVKDRKVRIELGKSYRDLYDSRMKEVIDQHMLPAFKQNDYSRGILQGTQAIAKVLSGAPVLDPPRTPVKASASRPGESIWQELVIWFVSLGLMIGVPIGILILVDRWRYGSFFPKGKGGAGRDVGWTGGGGSSGGGGGSSGGGGASGNW